jgi:hypothetical protein
MDTAPASAVRDQGQDEARNKPPHGADQMFDSARISAHAASRSRNISNPK